MISIRKTIASDYFDLEPRTDDDNMIFLGQADHEQIANIYEKHTDSFTIHDDDTIIAIGGIYALWRGVGASYFIASNKLLEYPFFVAKKTKIEFHRIIKERDYHRVQSPVRTDNPQAIRFVEWLGMSRESLMKELGENKENFYMYVLLSIGGGI